MSTNKTLKSFKNSQANVQIRQEELFSNSPYLDELYANDIATQTSKTLREDATFSTRGILSNLKDILKAKISGESSFLKESEIDALEVKTPAAIKKHKPKRKERKARKKAYKAELELIKQLEGQENITIEDVKAEEKRLLALEGYEDNLEINNLTDVKYKYLAEKTSNIQAVNDTDTLTNYYMEHSKLNSLYQEFNPKIIDEEFEHNLDVYKETANEIKEYSYDLRGEKDIYEEKYNSYVNSYNKIKDSNKYVDQRKWRLLYLKNLEKEVNELKRRCPGIVIKKKIKLQILEDHAKKVASVKNGDEIDFNDLDGRAFTYNSMLGDFIEYVQQLKNKLKPVLLKDKDNHDLELVNKVLKQYDYEDAKALSEFVKNFDGLISLIVRFDEAFKECKDIAVEYNFMDEEYGSMLNYIRRIKKDA